MTNAKPYVYVLDINGNPLMPTQRYGWVKRALKVGKAKVVRTVPFTIHLTYRPETSVTQRVVVGQDPGRTNIGLTCVREDGMVLYHANCETRNKEIPDLMADRKAHRQTRRRGERLVRKRRAKKYKTTMKNGSAERKLPGYQDGTVEVKDIINTEAKFNNRKRNEGWLTPTATQLLRTHLNLIEKVRKILPVTDVSLELNRFDFVKMDNPKTYKAKYGNGPMKGYGSVRDAIFALQGGKCLLCEKNGIDHLHHLEARSEHGSESLANQAGICWPCHRKIHTDANAAKELKEKKAGFNKKYGALSVLNQIVPHLVKDISEAYPEHTYLTTGYEIKQYRESLGLEKDHNIDAFCIAMAALGFKEPKALAMPERYAIRQYRRHDRAKIKAQTSRTYKLKGETVAKNRHPAMEVKDAGDKPKKSDTPALDQWYTQQVKAVGRKEANRMLSSLEVKKSYRRYNDTTRHLPGTQFLFDGKRYVMQGQITNGQYFRAVGCGNRNFPVQRCTVIGNEGLVYVK